MNMAGVPGGVQHVLVDVPEVDSGVYHGQGQEGVKYVLVGGSCLGLLV